MAPPRYRGRLNQLYQIVLTGFILVAYVINLIMNVTHATRWGWRLSLGFAFVPSLLLFLGGVFLPDSPNSLLERGFVDQVESKACISASSASATAARVALPMQCIQGPLQQAHSMLMPWIACPCGAACAGTQEPGVCARHTGCGQRVPTPG